MDEGIYKITFTGDILCKKQMLESARTTDGYDFGSVFAGVRHLLTDSDLVIGNLETPIIDEDGDLVRKRISFGAPKEFAKAIHDAGVHVVSTANNHALDRGIEGLESTIEKLDEIGIKHTGTFKSPEHGELTIEEKGVKIGILSYTYGTNAHHNKVYLEESEEWRVNLFQKQELHNPVLRKIFLKRDDSFLMRMMDRLYCIFHPLYIGKSVGERRQPDSYERERLDKDIDKMMSHDPDISVMCMHIGGQYNKKPSHYSKETAEYMRKKGVNLIIGNHEHVIHEADISHIGDNTLTAYCLGNFVSTSGVLETPYDKNAEYSCLLHVMIDTVTKKIKKVTYNILVIEKDPEGGVRTVNSFDRLQREKDPEKRNILGHKTLSAVAVFSGKRPEKPLEEYVLFEG